MQPLLYLVHRIPYPPNKGDKIRSYNILRYLSQYYDIYCGTFIDTPEDIQYQQKVNSFCKQTHYEIINPTKSKIKSLTGFFTQQALSVPYYTSPGMQQWVDDVITKYDIKKVLAFSSPVAQFVMDKELYKIMDFIDIDSDKWQQYSQSHAGIMSAVYAREARYLFKYEQEIAAKFDASLFVSEKEAQHFKYLLREAEGPQIDAKVIGVSNGIDFSYFDPHIDFQSPYQDRAEKKILVFTGAMDYWANVDAVVWFATEVFKVLHQQDNTYQFYIVGSFPTTAVTALSKYPGVIVTGRVEDVRPYIKYASLSVAPLRIARGIQNKVLEAMAMNTVVVATQNAMEGIIVNREISENIQNTPQAQIKRIQQLIENENLAQIGKQARDWIKTKYHWETVLEPLKQLINDQ